MPSSAMRSPRRQAVAKTSGATLTTDFGRRSPLAQEAIRTFYAAIADAGPQFLATWRTAREESHGPRQAKSSAPLDKLAAAYGIRDTRNCPDRLLLALHTYFATLVRLAVPEAAAADNANNLFDWPQTLARPELESLLRRLNQRFSSIPVGSGDIFKPLYQSLFPAAVRRALGEFYTPDWLAEHVLDELEYDGDPGLRLLDPACGSGTFLVAAIRRVRAWAKQPGRAAPTTEELRSLILQGVVGFDRNPLAVLAARANYILAIRDLFSGEPLPGIPIYEADSILGAGVPPTAAGPFDCVAGNPPWQVWDHLPPPYRDATKPLWQRYGLFTLSAAAARHGGGKKDLSMLMLYVAADRYLKDGGKLGFVINQTVFQTKGAGEGFRRLRIGSDGPQLRVLRVNDMVQFQPFDGATNWTSTLTLQKGEPTEWPVPYVRWSLNARLSDVDAGNWRTAFDHEHCRAEPIDLQHAGSPWRIRSGTRKSSVRGKPDGILTNSTRTTGPSDYVAHLGANTGGANGIYWVRLLERQGERVLVENLPAKGKATLPVVQFAVEAGLLYPLLQWRDVARYQATSSAHLLLVQDPVRRTGIPDERMRLQFPFALAYFERFQPQLLARAAYRRYQHAGPYWSMYNVGPYTLAPIKVVWRRMDRRMNAAVVTAIDDPLLGRLPVVPQETCVLIEAHSEGEAHYLCACLNSASVDEVVRSHCVQGGKGFGTPGMLEYLALQRFDPAHDVHLAVAELSRQAHSAASQGDASQIATLQAAIDEQVLELAPPRN